MDYLRAIQVPLQPTVLIMVAIFAMLLTFLSAGGLLGLFGMLIVSLWLLKYCYALIEHLANGSDDAPVLDHMSMLSSFEMRPWLQAILISGGGWLCWYIGGKAGLILAVVFLLLLPASIALIAMGAKLHDTVNPLQLFRVVRGLGPAYGLMLFAFAFFVVAVAVLGRSGLWGLLVNALVVWMLIATFSVIGVSIYVRREALGFEPMRSPERTQARDDAERIKRRDTMLSEVFQLAKIGKNIDATKPLADWFKADAGEHIAEDAPLIATRALTWNLSTALEPIGSTLVRYLVRARRPDIALNIYDKLCEKVPGLTLDTRADLMAIAAYAESSGRPRHADALRESATRMKFWGTG